MAQKDMKEHGSLSSFLLFMSVFPALNTVNPLIKICISRILKRRKTSDHTYSLSSLWDSYWIYFTIDVITYLLPITLYVTILNQTLVYLGVLIAIGLICYRITKTTHEKKDRGVEEPAQTIDHIDSDDSEELDPNVVRISVHSFRTLLFVITSIAILAVDFRTVFPRRFAKTSNAYGFSLMDVGVGYFIVGHAMRLIRNAEASTAQYKSSFREELNRFPFKFYQIVKKSSLLLIIGLVRLALVKLTGYRVSITEYGIHWNFFFTIFFVKVLASPIELLIRKSSFRALVVSLLIGGVYQYFLTTKPELTYYIISRPPKRETLIDANKEGIFSLFGYLSIYFAGVSVCHRIAEILNENGQEKKCNNQLSKALKCVTNLAIYATGFLLLTEITRTYVQNISRKMCNLGFVFFIMSTCTALWGSILAGIIIITLFLVWIAERSKSHGQSTSRRVLHLQDACFSFVKIMDSKLVGLAVFLIANLFTGLVNLSIESQKTQPLLALTIIFSNSLVSTFLPFLAFYINKRFCIKDQAI